MTLLFNNFIWCIYMVDMTSKTVEMIESFYKKKIQKAVKHELLFVVTFHFETSSCKADSSSFWNPQIVATFLLHREFASVTIAALNCPKSMRSCHSFLRLLITRLDWKCNREYRLCGTWGRKSLPFTLAAGSGEFIQSSWRGGGGVRGFQITGSQQV